MLIFLITCLLKIIKIAKKLSKSFHIIVIVCNISIIFQRQSGWLSVFLSPLLSEMLSWTLKSGLRPELNSTYVLDFCWACLFWLSVNKLKLVGLNFGLSLYLHCTFCLKLLRSVTYRTHERADVAAKLALSLPITNMKLPCELISVLKFCQEK